MKSNPGPRVIVALDFPVEEQALALADRLDPGLCRVKVGKELFTRSGPALVKRLHDSGFEVFLDLKFHDIPNTVAAAVKAAADLGVWMVNVHASGGSAMMQAAATAVENTDTLLIGVTVLTSMDGADLAEIGITATPAEQVLRLARLARQSGLHGVVSSSQEAQVLSHELGRDFVLVTPGIRPAGDAAGDQKRIVTPGQAITNGSTYLVIGRPITQAENPVDKLIAINGEISGNF